MCNLAVVEVAADSRPELPEAHGLGQPIHPKKDSRKIPPANPHPELRHLNLTLLKYIPVFNHPLI
jgi:hypothetical protein